MAFIEMATTVATKTQRKSSSCDDNQKHNQSCTFPGPAFHTACCSVHAQL